MGMLLITHPIPRAQAPGMIVVPNQSFKTGKTGW